MRMGIEAFRPAQRHRRRPQRAQLIRPAFQDRGSLHEVEHPKAGRESRRARRRQYVIRSADIIPDRFGSMGPKEDRAGITDLRRERFRIRRHNQRVVEQRDRVVQLIASDRELGSALEPEERLLPQASRLCFLSWPGEVDVFGKDRVCVVVAEQSGEVVTVSEPLEPVGKGRVKPSPLLAVAIAPGAPAVELWFGWLAASRGPLACSLWLGSWADRTFKRGNRPDRVTTTPPAIGGLGPRCLPGNRHIIRH